MPDETFLNFWIRRWQEARPQLKTKDPYQAVCSGILIAETLIERGMQMAGARVLDFGCGHGRATIGFLHYGITDYLGLDVRVEAIEFASRLFAGQPGYRFEHFDAANYRYRKGQGKRQLSLPAQDNYFTLALAVSVFTHEPGDAIVDYYLGELWRVLIPGGALLTTWLSCPPMDLQDKHWLVRTREDILRFIKSWRVLDSWGEGDLDSQWWVLTRKA